MISVIILGTGNVATHLINAFIKAKDIELVQVYGRNKEVLQSFKNHETTSNIDDIKDADVYIIAISDDAISSLSEKLNFKNKLVVHTSGSVSINALKSKGNKGVFYPLQTFSKENEVDFTTIPICIEAERNEDLLFLDKLAHSISHNIFFIDSGQRKYLHAAAVFANNFVNHMYKIGYDICVENNIPPETLYPLILETAKKATNAYPSRVQTGPAKRNDIKTITSHLELLSNENQKIYKILTDSIQKKYGKKL